MRTLTASEPLTLEEEYAMQHSWLTDADKLTFIVVDRSAREYGTLPHEEREKHGKPIGDVNIFLNEDEDTPLAECEVMVADAAYRGKGIGGEAIALLLSYYKQYVDAHNERTLSVKMSYTNNLSYSLFTKLGFVEHKRVEVFQEIELRHPSYKATAIDLINYA